MLKRSFVGGIIAAIFILVSCQVGPTFDEQTNLPKPDALGVFCTDDGVRVEYILQNVSEAHNDLQFIWMWMLTHPEYGKTLSIEIATPGGDALCTLRAIGIINQMKEDGFTIITEVNSMAASAGFAIFQFGSVRRASMSAVLMWHKVQFQSFFPPTEEQMQYINTLDKAINAHLAEQTGMSLDDILNHINDGNWWMTGLEAYGLGLADEVY